MCETNYKTTSNTILLFIKKEKKTAKTYVVLINEPNKTRKTNAIRYVAKAHASCRHYLHFCHMKIFKHLLFSGTFHLLHIFIVWLIQYLYVELLNFVSFFTVHLWTWSKFYPNFFSKHSVLFHLYIYFFTTRTINNFFLKN